MLYIGYWRDEARPHLETAMKGARESKRGKGSTVARKRYMATLAPDRRYLVELDDLMERMWRERSVWYEHEWPLGLMIFALERHLYKVRRLYYGTADINNIGEHKLRSLARETGKRLAPPTAEHSLPPTEAQVMEWENATEIERIDLRLQHHLFGTWFKKDREHSSRGRPPDRALEFRSKRIAAYTQVLIWEGEPHKGAIADAMTRYNCSRAAVYEARKQWCPQMKHLRPHFDRATAKIYRERIEKFEDRDLVRLGLDKSSD